ncbi:hypothetical protein CBOM_02946 [Ceraceosorus bombacis]|uniref:RPAP1/MINIYO-like TPR repeats domain-containing protein n=1 Tax=Ceraceosorus bombacis TaxID=401625 RepID=A0A0P1BGN7_9BASI|nr:hypothetical protein CBOM_02946 [Ceraceosorus bombacis]
MSETRFREMRKQSLRPRVLDYTEFDEAEAEAEAEGAEEIEWPAAANVITSTPPVIARKADSKAQSVASRAQSAMSAAHSVGQEQQQQQRGQADTDPDVDVDGDERSEDALAADIQPGPPLIADVRERRPLRASNTAHQAAPKQGMSRFAARRQLDRELHAGAGAGADARSHAAKQHSNVELEQSAAQHVQPMASASAAAAAPSSAPQDTSLHDWLEEDGRPMTALISTWLLRDRQMGVRRMALFALRCALRTTKRGEEAMLCVQPPIVPAPSSKKTETYEETIKRDMTRGLLNLAAPTLLVEMYGQDAEAGMEIVEDVLDCLCALAEASLDAARAVLQSAGIMDLINSSHALKASPPPLKVLQLLQLLSSVDRQAAAALANATSAHLLRLVALPCWTSARRAQDLRTHRAFVSTLGLFSIYAQFGAGLEHVVHSWAVFEQLTAHVQYRLESGTSMDTEELRAVGKMLRLMKAWITCARHPHRTQPQHALGWPHFGEWAELALSIVCSVPAELAVPDEAEKAFVLQGCAAGLLDVWIDLACNNARTADAAKTLVARLKDDADAIARLAQSAELAMLAAASRIARHDTLKRQMVEEFVEMLEACKHVVALLERCEAVSALQRMHKASRDLMRDDRLWTRFDEQDAWIAGYRVARHVASEFQGHTLKGLHGADGEKVDLAEIVEPVHSLDKGQEELAKQLVHVIQWKTRTTSLAPFMNESLRVKSSAAIVQGNGTLTGAATLWSTLQARGDEQNVEPGAEEQAEADPEDLDPLTGALLYKSSQSGLPLRSDWTLQALDDLLHSGTCAALNRKDVLPASWDYTEAQLVRDALHLTRMALQATLDMRRHDCLMTASELLLGMCKVFLLERDDAPTPQSTGDITGRNLFRDKEISGVLVQLFEMLPQLVASHAATDVQMSGKVAPFDGTRTRSKTMEEAACKETIAVPFYQIYTDLLGLYDGLSLGDEAFQRIILAGQSMLYASDYRRLLWIDHAHLLSTFTLQLQDAPLETMRGLQSYLYPAEQDPDVLRAFTAALMRGDVTRTRRNVDF